MEQDASRRQSLLAAPGWDGATVHSALRFQAAVAACRRFLTDGRHSLTFAETERRVNYLAGGLAAQGVKSGDRIALMLPNCVEFVLCWLACTRIGAAAVFVNPAYAGAMLDYVLADAAPSALIIHADALGQLSSTNASCRNSMRFACVIGTGQPPALCDLLWVDEAQLFEGPAFADDRCEYAGAPNCVIYTSGTTGPSKGVELSTCAVLAGSRTFAELTELSSDDILFSPMPLFHGLASRQGVLGCLLTGCEVVMESRFSASRFWDQVANCKATVALTMFNIPAMLKAQPRVDSERRHRLRAMYNSGHDPQFEQRFGVALLEAYGLVETGITIYSPASGRKPGSCGRLHRNWEARIVNPSGDDVPDGEIGELLLRPRRAGLFMLGYLNKAQATLDACRDFWFHTDDYVSRDSDGHYYFAGRQKERIRRRGENISAWEIEKIAAQHPSVQLCAAVGHPAAVGDDDVRLVLTLKDGRFSQPEEVHAWLAARLPPFMVPRYIEIVSDLPLTPTEKVKKSQLIERGLGEGAWDREAAKAQG